MLGLFGWLLIPALGVAFRVFPGALLRGGEGGRHAWLVPLFPVLACASLFAWWIPFLTSGEELVARYGRVAASSLRSAALTGPTR